MKLRLVAAATALAAISATSFAQSTPAADTGTPARGTGTPLIDKQEANQQQRIKEGKQSGELTHHEAHRLKGEQKAIGKAQTKAAADGTVTTQERQRIRKMQARSSRDIHRQKHDAATAPTPAPANAPAATQPAMPATAK